MSDVAIHIQACAFTILQLHDQRNKRCVEKEHAQYLRQSYGTNAGGSGSQATYWASRNGSRSKLPTIQ